MDGKTDLASLIGAETEPSGRQWTIGELARECDVTLRAMRFYEAKGLLRPTREGQTRRYGDAERRRLLIVLRAKRVGFSLAEIRELLNLTASRQPLADRLAALRDRLIGQHRQLVAARDDAEAALVDIAAEIAALEGGAPTG